LKRRKGGRLRAEGQDTDQDTWRWAQGARLTTQGVLGLPSLEGLGVGSKGTRLLTLGDTRLIRQESGLKSGVNDLCLNSPEG